jgi:5'-nucleotidase / UDP-sugar diphosphatase
VRFALLCFVLAIVSVFGRAPAGAEAVIVLVGDQHSAYERTAAVVADVARLRTEYPQLPMAICIDGDVFERGNAIALRSQGQIDLAMLAALARLGPTILNLGNHEPEFYDLPELVERVKASGVIVVSNVVDRGTGRPVASASARVPFGQHTLTVVGLSTDRLATFPAFVRQALHIPDPVAWAKQNLPSLLAGADVTVVLSHAGVRPDREWLPIVPNGTLVAGAHDHLRFVHREGATVYVHSGSWNEFVTHAWLTRDAHGGCEWTIEQVPISSSAVGDAALTALVREVEAKHGTPADRALVGHLARERSPTEAERYVASAVRAAAKVDAAFIGHTTFGAGLPAGDVTQLAFDACVRFDGTIFTGEVSGSELRELLAQANQTPDTPWSQRRGEYLAAAGPATVDLNRRYTIAVTDWIAHSPATYLGTNVTFTEQPGLRLKSIAADALHKK